MERIASTTIGRRVLFDNQRTMARLTDLQLQLSSGKRINVPSDDPSGVRQSLLLRASSSAIDGYSNNIDRSAGFLQTTDNAFSSATDLLNQVHGYAVQGGTDSMTPEARQTLADQVDSALTQLVDVANTIHDGRSVFAGTATTTTPFILDSTRSTVAYQGTKDPFAVQISPTTSIEVGTDGQSVFQGRTDAFAVLTRLRDALRNDDGTAVRGMIGEVAAAQDQITDAYGALGGRTSMLEMVRTRIGDVQSNLDEQASQIEDADLAQVITDFKGAQMALEAGLQSGAKIIQPTLLDYLH